MILHLRRFMGVVSPTAAALTILCCTFLPIGAQAKMNQTKQAVDLTDVTVFLRGAELFSSVTVSLPAGESEVILSNVAGGLNPQSLSIAADNGVMVLSSGIRNDYLDEEELVPGVQALKDELDAAIEEKTQEQIKLNVLNEQLEVLKANRQLAQTGGSVTTAEVGKMLDLVSTKTYDALTQQAQINQAIVKIDERIQKLSRQLAEERNKGVQPGGRIAVKFYAPQAVTTHVRLSYVVHDAGWVPAYDLHVEKINTPVHLTYKASVFQNTGINWDKVNLTLSTGNPSLGAQAPVLNPWYIQVARPMAAAQTGIMAEMAPAAPVVAVARQAKLSDSVNRDAEKRVAAGTLDGYVTTNAQGLNTSFDIAIPYTVPSDGKGHMILVQSTDLAASYYYAATPKLDPDAFLLAKITDWKELNLLPGVSNIYFENSFVGQGQINLLQIKEGLEVSLGRDKRIIVERIEDQNNHGGAGLFGGSTQRTLGYTIKVTNARPDAVKLMVYDQLPVSQDEDIKLQDLKLAGGKHDEKTGKVTWEMDLKPSENRTIEYSYTVKYPKEVEVWGL